MSDEEFIAQLEAGTLPEDQFHHADHLHAAWLYLTRFPAAEALARFSKVLRRYAASLGKADRYHETITWAYLLLLNERIRRGPHRDVGTICRHVRRPVRLEELDPAEVLSPGNVALRAGAPGLPHARSTLNVPFEGILTDS